MIILTLDKEHYRQFQDLTLNGQMRIRPLQRHWSLFEQVTEEEFGTPVGDILAVNEYTTRHVLFVTLEKERSKSVITSREENPHLGKYMLSETLQKYVDMIIPSIRQLPVGLCRIYVTVPSRVDTTIGDSIKLTPTGFHIYGKPDKVVSVFGVSDNAFYANRVIAILDLNVLGPRFGDPNSKETSYVVTVITHPDEYDISELKLRIASDDYSREVADVWDEEC